MSILSVPTQDEHYYRCNRCGFWNVKKAGVPSGRPVTKRGDFHYNESPPIQAYSDLIYTATTISFTIETATETAKINDSALQFGEKHFLGGMTISVVTGSGLNDGDFTISDRGVSRGTLSLSATDSLTTETAAAAGEVNIYREMYKPYVSQGCPLCSSLASLGSLPKPL